MPARRVIPARIWGSIWVCEREGRGVPLRLAGATLVGRLKADATLKKGVNLVGVSRKEE